MVPALDASGFPIVRLTFGESLSTEEVDVHEQNVLSLFNRRGRMVIVADMSRVDSVGAPTDVRIKIAGSADKLAEKQVFVAELVVVPSTLARAIFTAYAWARRRTPHPVRAFATMDAALRHAHDLIGVNHARAD